MKSFNGKHISINIEERHIRYATRESCAFCPAALALSEYFREPWFAGLGECYNYSKSKVFRTPINLYRFMVAFDTFSFVSPIEFECELFPL